MKAIAFVDYENIWTGLLERGYELTPEQLVQFLEVYTERTNADLLAIYLYASFEKEELALFLKTAKKKEASQKFSELMRNL